MAGGGDTVKNTSERDTPTPETARKVAEGQEPDELERDPAQDELETDATVPDPEDAFLERDDTHYTEEESGE